jgi:regulator of protease activity HflC (stomatin/prohibitin superfamily)
MGPFLLILLIVLVFTLLGFRVVRPVEVRLVERLGKYHRTIDQGLRWIIPFIDRAYSVRITEIRQDVPKQSVITKDNLNLQIDGVVYYKIKDPVKAQYNIDDFYSAIPSLAQTTLRSIIGELEFVVVNAQRHTINQRIEAELDTQTEAWGIDILRVELQDVHPSMPVQQAMDKVVTAEREKEAKITAAMADKEAVRQQSEAMVIDAEASKRSAIERATGQAQAIRLEADAKAEAIRKVNDAAEETFKENARKLKALEVTEASLRNNAKVVLTEKGISPTIVLNESGDTVIPVK